MTFYELYTERRMRAKRIKQLKKQKSDLDQTVHSHVHMAYVDHELKFYDQFALQNRAARIGLAIPAEKYSERPRGSTSSVLNDDGRAWLIRELRKHRRSEVEFWSKLVLPIISLIIAVIALLKRSVHCP